MADRDTVIVGIGHSSLHPNATSQKLVNPGLLKLAKQDSGYDYKRNVITEYFYCRGLALMICEELSKLGLKGVTSNRYKDSDINGGSMQDRAMGAEISAINRALPSLNNPKCAINLHLNAFKANQASGAEAYCPNTEHGKILGRMLNKAVSNTLGINFRKVVPASVTTKDLPGMGFPRSVRVPGVLLELFFVDNNEDLKKGLEKKKELAVNLAKALKDFCDKNYPAFDPNQALEESYVKSSALVQDKIQNKVDDDQLKTIAIQTQENLLPIERALGEGGDNYDYYLKNNIRIVGTKPVPFTPSLIDATGNVTTTITLREGGTVNKQIPYPLFQNTDYTSDFPTGKEIVYVQTLYEMNSYEINFNSSGHTRINAGGNVKITAGQQVDIISPYVLNMEGGEIVSISANNIAVSGNTTIEGVLGVTKGVISSGPIYAQGGLAAPAFNGPATIDKTNEQELYGYLAAALELMIQQGRINVNVTGTLATAPISEGATSITVTGGSLDFTVLGGGSLAVNDVKSGLGVEGKALVTTPPHLHYFKRLNGTLANSAIDIQQSVAPTLNQ